MKRHLSTILVVVAIVLSVIIVLVVATFVAIKGNDPEVLGTVAKLIAYATVAAVVGLIALSVWVTHRLRLRAIAKKRPGALVIHGTAPALTLKRPDAPEEELKQAEEFSSEGASLVVTDEAFEIWSNADLVEPIRSIPNTPDVRIWREDRFFNVVSTSKDTQYIYLEATVIRGPSGLEIVFRTIDEPTAFNSIVEAKAKP